VAVTGEFSVVLIVLATTEAKSAGPEIKVFRHGEYTVPLMAKLIPQLEPDDDTGAPKPNDKVAIDWVAAWAFGLSAPPVSAELVGLKPKEGLGNIADQRRRHAIVRRGSAVFGNQRNLRAG
jgi:hypothetical protein